LGIGQKYSGILPVDNQHCRPGSIVYKTAEPTRTSRLSQFDANTVARAVSCKDVDQYQYTQPDVGCGVQSDLHAADEILRKSVLHEMACTMAPPA
jgi:hypothetical protein